MRINFFRVLALVLSLHVVGAICLATPMNFSGTWKLNIEKSKFGALPGPVSRTINITHRDPALKLEVTETTANDNRSSVLEYTTDGKKCINKVRGMDFRSIVQWQQGVLVIETEGIYQGEEFHATDRWTLSPDGKTITILREASNKYGETHQTLILEKQ